MWFVERFDRNRTAVTGSADPVGETYESVERFGAIADDAILPVFCPTCQSVGSTQAFSLT
jgi:hypothetical protein